MKQRTTPQWIALLNAIERARTEDLEEWKRIGEKLARLMTADELRELTARLQARAGELAAKGAR